MTTRERIQKIEARLDALEAQAPGRHMGVGPALEPNEKPLPSITPKGRFLTTEQRDILGDLLDFVRSGRRIEAIRCYRMLTGAGLKESKDAIMGEEVKWT